jgi:hypothetical protein
MEQTRIHRTGHAIAGAEDLLAMAISSCSAGRPISGAADMEALPSSRTDGMMSLHAAARAAAPGHLVLYRVGEFYEVLGPDRQSSPAPSAFSGRDVARRTRRTSRCAASRLRRSTQRPRVFWRPDTRLPYRNRRAKTGAIARFVF